MKLNEPISAPKFWIIRLEESPIHSWNNSENKILFNWSYVSEEFKNTKNDVQIGLAQSYPDISLARIKSLSKTLMTLHKIETSHFVLGVDSMNILKFIGKVENNSTLSPHDFYEANDSRRKATIELSNIIRTNFDLGDLSFLPKGTELAVLTKTNIRKSNLPLIIHEPSTKSYFKEDLKYSHGPLFKPEFDSDGLLVDQKAHYYEIKHSESKDQLVPKKADGVGIVRLFYATTRSISKKSSKNKVQYGSELADLSFGQCEVSIPKKHTQGEIERPNIWKFEFTEDPTKHVVINEIKSIPIKEFIDSLKSDLTKLDKKSALLFVHGYNNSFEDAARRTAQIVWDIPFNGLCGFFSWPSANKTSAYLKDIECADASIPSFEKLIKDLVISAGVEQLHIIAHSMGNRILATGLSNLSSEKSYGKLSKKIRQIVLAAPDLDQAVFKESILPKFQKIGKRRTLYASEHDKALAGAELIRRLPRLGDAGDDLFVADKIDTIDTSEIKKGIMNHSYAFDTKELLTDLYYLLNQDLAPVDRRLRARSREKLKYWLFPK